jgi:hypothetical protein
MDNIIESLKRIERFVKNNWLMCLSWD